MKVTSEGTLNPTVRVIEDITEPVPEPCAYRFNPATHQVLMEFAINQLETKQPVKVLKIVRDWVSNGVIVYYVKIDEIKGKVK